MQPLKPKLTQASRALIKIMSTDGRVDLWRYVNKFNLEYIDLEVPVRHLEAWARSHLDLWVNRAGDKFERRWQWGS